MENKRSYYAILIPTLWTVWLACVGQSCARHPKVKPPMPGPPRCPNCGPMVVPYPLSTGPNCGDQAYKINCVGGKLYFGALHGSSYLITSINPVTQRIIIHPPGFASSGSCLSADVSKAGLELDPHLPFSITNSNTILLLGCPEAMLQVKYFFLSPGLNIVLAGSIEDKFPVKTVYIWSGSHTKFVSV